MDEVRSGLPELRQVGDHRLVRAQKVSVAATATRAAEAAAGVLLRLQRDGQVGADAGEWVERLLLRAIEAVREARDRDDERDGEPEPDEGEDRPGATADELVAEIAEVEHSPSRSKRPESSLRRQHERASAQAAASGAARSPCGGGIVSPAGRAGTERHVAQHPRQAERENRDGCRNDEHRVQRSCKRILERLPCSRGQVLDDRPG